MTHYLEHDETLDFIISPKCVKRLMSVLHLKCQSRVKKYHRIKQAEQELRDNILNQRFDLATKPNQVWLSDSTEVRYGINDEYKMRLCGVLDLYGRYLLAYKLSVTETSEAMMDDTFKQAFKDAGNVHPVVHTDRGVSLYCQGFQ